MKKIIAFTLTFIMSLSILTGCGSDPVAEELEKFINTDMVEINKNQKALKSELENWESFTEDAEVTASITDVLIPNLEDSLDKLSKIKLSTDEVKALKSKYEEGLTTYKDAYELMLSSSETGDEEAYAQSSEMLADGSDLFNEYNEDLKALAKEKDMTLE